MSAELFYSVIRRFDCLTWGEDNKGKLPLTSGGTIEVWRRRVATPAQLLQAVANQQYLERRRKLEKAKKNSRFCIVCGKREFTYAYCGVPPHLSSQKMEVREWMATEVKRLNLAVVMAIHCQYGTASQRLYVQSLGKGCYRVYLNHWGLLADCSKTFGFTSVRGLLDFFENKTSKKSRWEVRRGILEELRKQGVTMLPRS